MSRLFLIAGSILGALGVAAGAFGAHALDGLRPPARMDVFETAARYQMYHALALIGVAWIVSRTSSRLPVIAGYLFLAGTVIFSGSLYLLVLSDTSWWGAVTPVGGAAFIAGWVVLALAAGREKDSG